MTTQTFKSSSASPTRRPFDRRAALALALFLGLCFGAAALGAYFTTPQTAPPDGWYAQLAKPEWNPPAWVFAPVWTTLYAMMAAAAWLVWRRGRPYAAAMTAFGVQLALNVLWSALFFGLQRPDLAFAEILLLWAAIVVTILLFRRRSGWAAGLLLPYLAWVSFAAVLNFTVWQLNA